MYISYKLHCMLYPFKIVAMVVYQAVNNLKEMGFQEEEILMALKATGNNQEAAVSLRVLVL